MLPNADQTTISEYYRWYVQIIYNTSFFGNSVSLGNKPPEIC